ncbi:MAG: IMP cyclohydrolase, partial [Lentisphaerae bacterium]
MSGSSELSRKTYLSRQIGDFPDDVEIMGRRFRKQEDLRYGTNPHQPAALYCPIDEESPVIGGLEVLKTGKSGLSQTNLEDISYALNIVKFFDQPACACMKHVNPCGVAVGYGDVRAPAKIYRRARLADPRAAFGCTAGFNCTVDAETATAIMEEFTECVVAPDFTEEALQIFNDQERFKLNKHIRVLRCGDLAKLPRYRDDVEDVARYRTIKVLHDGSLVIADPLLTALKSTTDLKPATAQSKKRGSITSTVQASPQQLADLLTAWYVNINVRSNGVVIVKNGVTLAVGTGEQDRVGAVEQAIEKCRNKYAGSETIDDSVMASDGFFPFPDAVEVAA